MSNDVTADYLTRFICREIDTYEYVLPEGAVGNPWPQERVDRQLAQLRACLVAPYKLTFERCDTMEDCERETPRTAEYWIVANDGNGFLVFYDPSAAEFGLAQLGLSDRPVTIGVRGDVVGVFMSR